MKGKQKMLTLGTIALTALTGLSPVTSMAASSTVSTNNVATAEDLGNSDIIDEARTASISIYKYDITAAEAAGSYEEGIYKATGQTDKRVENAMKNYAIEGVQFSYLRVGDVETHSISDGNRNTVELVCEIPTDLAKILKLDASDAVNMTSAKEAYPCDRTGVWHFTSQQVQDAMQKLSEADDVAAKNALENYLYEYGSQDSTTDQKTKSGVVNMDKTDKDGFTHADNLELGLYLMVETEVPENVTETVNPWFIQLPFTDTGEQWLYRMTCYPKDQTGNPTLDKSVRKTNDAAYGDTTTASGGDRLDYILVSKLPHITSEATYLSEYTFVDTLSKGITYNKDVRIAFYHTAQDANANNTANADFIWNLSSGDYTQEYANVTVQDPGDESGQADGASRLTVSLTEAGLNIINGKVTGGMYTDGLSDYYMVVYYTAKVNSDASVILGDAGNPNDVQLIWNRTSDGYYNMLEDRNYVYSYGMDLTKTFSDNKGDFSNVHFRLYNGTDDYYAVAKQDSDGVYYITGKTTDEAKATAFTPNAADGSLNVNGMEADTYQLTEVATDDGYNLLKDQITIDITATDRDVIASVAGVTGMDETVMTAIAEHYNGGIYDENGNLVSESSDELLHTAANVPESETANGRTIGKTDMYVGAIRPASSVVDGMDANMTEGNASVLLSVNNTKGFLLPRTGGNGLYLVTILGVITVAGGCYLVSRKRKIPR